MYTRVSPVASCTAVTVQRLSALDQSAATIFRPYWIFSSTPYSAAVSAMYWRIDGPSASTLRSCHGRHL